jgi:hypothetical protein
MTLDQQRGYIAMPRSIFGPGSFADEPYTEREAFLGLVADATWKPRRIRLNRGAVDLERGQILTSSRFLAERWQWPEPRVRRFLNRLSGRRANDAQNDAPNDAQNDALIDAQPTADGTIITIRNYDVFQKVTKAEDPTSDAQNDAQVDAPNDSPLDPKSTQREELIIKNNTHLKVSESARATQIPDDFSLNDQAYNLAIDKLGSNEAVDRSVSRFVNHYRQVTGDRSKSRDWQAKALNWIDDDANKASPDKSASKLASSSFAAATTLTDGHWDGILSTYVRTGHWTRHVDQCGSEPPSPGCRAPRHLLIKHGIIKEAAA